MVSGGIVRLAAAGVKPILGSFAYPPKTCISGFEFAILVEMRTLLLKSSGFLYHILSKSELNTELGTDCELIEYLLPRF